MTEESELSLFREAAWVKEMATARSSGPDEQWQHSGGTIAHVLMLLKKEISYIHAHTYPQTHRASNAYRVKRIAFICMTEKEVPRSNASMAPRLDEWLWWRWVNAATIWIAPLPKSGQFPSLTHHGDPYVLPLSGCLAGLHGRRRFLVLEGDRCDRSTHTGMLQPRPCWAWHGKWWGRQVASKLDEIINTKEYNRLYIDWHIAKPHIAIQNGKGEMPHRLAQNENFKKWKQMSGTSLPW